MQTGTLGMVRGGQWLRSSFCPDGSFVNGYQMQYGEGNATGEITGLRLNCSELDQNYKLKSVSFLNANGATISAENSLSVTANRQAVGFSMARWTDAEDFEHVFGRKLNFFGEAKSDEYKYPREANSTLLVTVGCPNDWAICGVQARQLTPSGFEDSEPISILTQLRFKCCYYCIPQEKRVILDDYTNPGSTDYSRTIRKTVGTQVDNRKSTSGSTSSSRDKTRESQVGNSKSLSSSQSENEGQTESKSEGESASKGWNTGEDLRISTSSQNSKDTRTSNSISTSETDSLSVGKSTAKTDSNHWSNTKGTSSSHTAEASLEVKATAGFDAFGAKAEVAVTAKGGYTYNTAQHEDNQKGGGSQTEDRKNEDNTKTQQKGTSRDDSSGTSNTDSSGKDRSQSKGASGGTALNKEQSRQRSIQKAKERSVQEGAQAMFTQRQAEQKSWQFSWDQSSSSMWREEREDIYSFTCEAMHRCRIEQIYGTCGTLQIGTPKIEKRIDLLKYGLYGGSPQLEPETDINKTKEIQWEIKIPGETWVVVKGISHWEPSGRWQSVQVCPPDTIVTGHMFKNLPRAGITGIALVCSEKNGPDEGESEHEDVNILQIYSEDEPERNRTRGRWGVLTRGSRSIFAEGYSFTRTEMKGRRSVGNQEIIYRDIKLMKIPKQMAVNSTRVVTKCPVDHAICGVTAMMDKAGIGILTAIGLKCCHHCIPEEKWISVHHFDNNSPADERKEVRTTVGLSRTQTMVNSTSGNAGNTINSAGISRSGLHAGFSAKFGKSNSTGFDWSHTSNSIWTDETMVTEIYTCSAFHSCEYKKLEGRCGTARVPVDKFQKVSVPLEGYAPVPVPVPNPHTDDSDSDADSLSSTTAATATSEIPTTSRPAGQEPIVRPNEYQLEDESTPVQVTKSGEIWIEAQNIQSGDVNEDRIWGKSASCPLGTFVTGYRITKLGGEDEDTKELLGGVDLECSRWDAQGNFTKVKFIQSEQSARGSRRPASDTNPNTNPNPNQDIVRNQDASTPSPAVGFHFFSYSWFNDDGEQLGQSTTGHSLIFDRMSTPDPPDFENTDYQVKVLPEIFICPTNYVICGVRTRKGGNTGVLTDVKFRCCYHCEPSEMEQQLDHRQNPTQVMRTHTIPHASVGAVVEVKNPLIESNTPNTFTLDNGFSDYQYLKEMFSHRLPKKSKESGGQSNFDWSKQPKSLWTKETETSVENHCKPGHICVVSQLVGVCGKFQIPTLFTSTQYTLINDKDEQEGNGG